VVQISVLWTASTPQFRRSYDALALRWPHVTFVEETDFANQVHEIAAHGAPSPIADKGTQASGTHAPPTHVMFNVDDVYFFRPVDLDACVAVLEKEPLVWTYHIKLFKGATFCQPADRDMCLPLFTPWSNPDGADAQSTALFDLSGAGNYDWDYPWDLSGSLYRSCDVLRVLDTVVDARIAKAAKEGGVGQVSGGVCVSSA
jgi:hypothetical protein